MLHHDIDNHIAKPTFNANSYLFFWRQQTVNALLALLAACLSLNFISMHNNVHYDAPILAVCRKNTAISTQYTAQWLLQTIQHIRYGC